MEKYPNIVILLNLPIRYIPKAEFVLRTYCAVLRLNPKFLYGTHFESVHVYYGMSTDQEYPIKIHFNEQTADFFELRELYPLDKVNFRQYKNEFIPFLFSRDGMIFSFDNDHCLIRKDIVASGFYFLTCWHEYIMSFHGQAKDRVDFKQSLQYRWDFTEVPVVDVYCQMLLYVMGIYLPEFVRDIHWGENSGFAVSLSHDIDYWDFWTARQRAETLKYNASSFLGRPLSAIYKAIGHTLHKNLFHNPWRIVRNIVRQEAEAGVKSTWFLLARDDFADERQNYITNIVAREQIIDLLGQQEVGLHGSPESAFDSEVLKQELETLRALGFNPTGFRTHYLHFNYQKSFTILENAGIEFDSTLGYWENIGFRAGISFPFSPFNIEENRPFRVLEIPLIVMDTTLYSHRAMNLSRYAARRSLKRLIDMAAKYQSHLSLLWHNTSFDPIDYPGWSSLYWKTIAYAQRKRAWVTSLRDIYEDWQLRK
ncbi:MAG: polysaccharide deacetylase family protein [Candidatus Cloacimonadaceae bacterium]|nr:polysaccharide deacetylase family protein [Candidatus Cloacimonadaceae bacterium]MDP3113359.1 polysaccharide deacetylase family protein [Candidatus Cloacimonadaceae bacterium]